MLPSNQLLSLLPVYTSGWLPTGQRHRLQNFKKYTLANRP